MDRQLYVQHRSPRRRRRAASVRVWFGLGLACVLLFALGLLAVRAVAGDWLDLKLESARYRILDALPQPDRPEFVATPILTANGAAPAIDWNKKVARNSSPTAAPAVIAPTEPPAVSTSAPTPSAAESAPPATESSLAPAPAARPTHPTVQVASTNPAAAVAVRPIQPSVLLSGITPEAQRFNNCGPTTLRMYLSFFGYTTDTQVQIADILKPNKDDKNVSPDELLGFAESRGFRGIVRVNGDLDRIRLTISNGLPIMIEEGYDPPRAHKGWMGHYLLINGYDENGITAQDSYNGPDQHVTWQDLDATWRHFNRTYLLFSRPDQEALVHAMLGDELDDATMYAQAAQRAQDEWNANGKDAFAPFNLGSSLVGLGEYESAAAAFDQARLLKIPWRMMWYQFGPYVAYYQTGRYDELVALADATQKNVGDLEESYYYKALALAKLGRLDQARASLQLALQYNPHYAAASKALSELGS